MPREILQPLDVADPYTYQYGFQNIFQSEVSTGAIPDVGNSPKVCAGGLTAELLSGTPQSTRRVNNLCSWMYRRRPSVRCARWEVPTTPVFPLLTSACQSYPEASPALWNPPPPRDALQASDFLEGLRKLGCGGDVASRSGYQLYQYRAERSMEPSRAFCNADGHLLIIPVTGAMIVQTEFGLMLLQPREVAVVPQGVVFAVRMHVGHGCPAVSSHIEGFMLETLDGPFTLPIQGVVGSSGLANPRDFAYPVAFAENKDEVSGAGGQPMQVFHKLGDHISIRHHPHTVFDVEGWHGNYLPFKYDTGRFCAVNTVTYDHMDPCIGTLLSVFCGGNETVSVLDVVLFVPQRKVAIDTFRPPNFHRNCMTEILGVISGGYEARPGLLRPGSVTLHNVCTPHGPVPEVVEGAKCRSDDVEEPQRQNLAFMVEARMPMRLSNLCSRKDSAVSMHEGYAQCWSTVD